MNEIGLFPLGMVLLPGERVPLHVFEERYKELIGECLAAGARFGLILAQESGIRTVGTRAAVVDVIRRYPDGRLDIIVEGEDRFRVVEVTEGRPFVTAAVEELADEGSEVPTDEEVTTLLESFERLAEAAEADADVPDAQPDGLAFRVASRVDFGAEAKQELLELRSERERVRELTEYLDRATALMRRQREVRDRASGNGQVLPDRDGDPDLG